MRSSSATSWPHRPAEVGVIDLYRDRAAGIVGRTAEINHRTRPARSPKHTARLIWLVFMVEMVARANATTATSKEMTA